MKTVKIVGMGKSVYVQTEKGSILLLPGMVADVPENEAKIVIGIKRARLYDALLDSPPLPPVAEPEPPVVETAREVLPSQPHREGRVTKKSREG